MPYTPQAQAGPYKWGDDIKTSFHGRRAGLDANDFNVGGLGGRDPIELWNAGSTGSSASSTAPLCPGGISLLTCTSNSTFVMPAPAEQYMGAGKTINFSSSSATIEVDLPSGNFQTSVSSTYTKITFTGQSGLTAASLYLQCLSTAYWTLNGTTGATGNGSSHVAFS